MDERTRFLILSLDGESYAVPLTRLLEITVPRGLQRDPGLTELFEGKYEYRGRWVPVVSLKKLLKLPGGGGAALLVVQSVKGVLGLLADAVVEIADLDQRPTPIPAGVLNASMRYFSGVLRHKGALVLLLNEDGLLP